MSFFDDFHIINGIPAFIICRDKYHNKSNDNDDEKFPMKPENSTIKNINFRSVFSVKSGELDTGEMVTCSCFNEDGTLLICGYKDGNLLVWDANHKHLLYTYERLHKSAIANVVFHKDCPFILISCDFKGAFVFLYFMWLN